MRKNHSHDTGIMTVSKMVEFLQSLSKRYSDWPICCCGSDTFYLCVDEENRCIIVDEEDIFENYDEEWTDNFS